MLIAPLPMPHAATLRVVGLLNAIPPAVLVFMPPTISMQFVSVLSALDAVPTCAPLRHIW